MATQSTRGLRTIAFFVTLPVILALGVVLVPLVAPLYLLYRLLLRIAVEIAWGRHGRRILLVYSRSPVWQKHVEREWIPHVGNHAVVLDWSDRATWKAQRSLAVRVFEHWRPQEDFNPMAILFPRFRPVRRIGFYYAFRDWKHGKERTLIDREAQLFAFLRQLQR